MQTELIVFQIIVLIYSIVLHEIAHGYAALRFGDRTALYAGRLTLNPIPHVDLIGSLLLPFTLILSGSPIVAGWAKPVPVNETNLYPYKFGSFVVSIAGVTINFALAFIFLILGVFFIESNSLKNLVYIVCSVNMALGLFNLIPFPPADGYRILSIFLPYQIKNTIENLINQNFYVTIIGSIILASILFSTFFPIVTSILRQIIF